MICVNCNTPVPDHSKFCLACGSLVSDPDVQSAATRAIDESATIQMENLLRQDTEGEFTIGELIGKGGMAAVYLATEIHLSRKVAIKVLPPELTFGHGIERFKREAKIAAALDHPNIIPIHRIASGGKVFWYAMKYLEGDALDETLRAKERFTLDETTEILTQVADALDYAHEHDVVHRDIKPANVMLDRRGRVVVTDFGIAKPLTEVTLTASGSVVGTPYYMSPEQGAGRPVDGTSDQYSLAVMAYEMLSGVRPFDGDSAIDIVHKHVMVEPPPLEERCPKLPPHVYTAIHKALAKKPEQRFASVGEFVQGLKAPWASPGGDTVTELPSPATTSAVSALGVATGPAPPAKAKRPPLAGTLVVFVVALLAGAAWWAWWQLDPRPPPNTVEPASTVQASATDSEAAVTAETEPPEATTVGAATDTTSEPPPQERQAQATVRTVPTAPPPVANARVSIIGLPDEGTVTVDDGTADPARSFALAPGRHILSMAAPGFETIVDTVQLSANDNVQISYPGRPIPSVEQPTMAEPDSEPRDLGPPAILIVRIRGGWANIFVDDTFKRRAQFTLPDTLPPGTHSIRLQRPGFVQVDTTITLRSGERRMITLPIRRRRGR